MADLPEPPPAPDVRSVEFIEFAVSDVDERELAALFEGLGFGFEGRHRTKDVDLYAQGAINLVVNWEREGFAHSFNILHGPSICALALRVDSVRRALDRAEAFDTPISLGKIGPGEASIPAVSGVEGSFLHLLDDGAPANWRDDFQPAERRVGADALEAIDHLSNVVRRSEFLTWSRFYKVVLGFHTEAPVEIADPHGAIMRKRRAIATRSV